MSLIAAGLYFDPQEFSPGQSVPVPEEARKQEYVMRSWNGDHTTPLVSIICHCYNHEGFIRNALDGILMQETDFPFEIIVHDDASTDRSVEIIKEYQRNFPDIVKPIFQQVNQFSQGKRPLRFSLPAAKGDFIALCEGDDYWISSKKLQLQADLLRERPDVVICFHNAIRVSENGEFRSMMNPCAKSELSQAELSLAPFVPTLTRMFRNYGCPWADSPNAPIANDICLTAFLSQYGGAVYVSSGLYSVYRHHEGGVWSQKDRYTQARMSIDSRLFIAAGLDGNLPVSDEVAGEHVKLSLPPLMDLLGWREIVRSVSSYLWLRLWRSVKSKLTLK
ncbi:glycosyltransferase [Alcanivorax sp. S6407]|uniref:glycosyltransferase family 2 protein n=1 Tax=Alcanivorax sp. S6407 TaxID=2926424 RepID=UPI001FF5F9B0|nr:glycosyltransferase [Alcanivorax sp. S6407]MCK0152855.1 glycosyltransferase [Alcanivorax sp. S6407]